MQEFLARHRSEVKGVLNGWDRIRFRGTLRPFSYVDGMMKFLSYLSVLLKDFRAWAQSLTDMQRQATQKFAAAIRKVKKSHRYQVTANGRVQITAIFAAQHAATEHLTKLAV